MISRCLFLPFLISPAHSLSPGVVHDLARGSALKCIADLSGGLPCEVWKSSVVLEQIRAHRQGEEPASSTAVLRKIVQERGANGLWSGCSARMFEGFFSGAVLLAGKETLRKTLKASPIVRKNLSPAVIGFVAGAGGGVAQAIVMTPSSLLVTATTANGGSVVAAARDILSRKGVRGVYRGSSAVAARQATNWASRQGFTELIRPRLSIAGVPGEIVAGCLGGAFSCWNTPFEVARIESQSSSFSSRDTNSNDGEEHHTLFETMEDIVMNHGFGGLYTGILPRICQSCYQTLFLVTIPRLLDS